MPILRSGNYYIFPDVISISSCQNDHIPLTSAGNNSKVYE